MYLWILIEYTTNYRRRKLESMSGVLYMHDHLVVFVILWVNELATHLFVYTYTIYTHTTRLSIPLPTCQTPTAHATVTNLYHHHHHHCPSAALPPFTADEKTPDGDWQHRENANTARNGSEEQQGRYSKSGVQGMPSISFLIYFNYLH